MSKNINTGLIINPLSGDTNALDVVGNQSISGNLTQTDASAETSLANGDIYIDSVAAFGIPAIWLNQTGAKTLTNASFWQSGAIQGHSVATGGEFQFRINDQANSGAIIKIPTTAHEPWLRVGDASVATHKYISMGGGQYGLGLRGGALEINTLSTGKIFFSGYDGSTTPTDLMTINAVNGNVGIGTSTPTESLEVIGNSKISGTLNLGNIGSGTSLTNLGWDSSGNVVSGNTSNGIFDVSNSGGTVPSSFDYTLTDSIQQTAANSYIKHEDREFAMVGTALGDRSYSISRSLANTSGNGSVFMLNNAGLTDNDRIDFLLQNYSGGASSKTELNFRRSNIGAGSGGSWIDFIMQSGINQNLYFNYNTNGSTPYGDVIVQNGNFVIKNLGTGTSITNIGVDSSGTLVSGTTGGSSDGNGIYDGSGSLTTGTTIASGGYDLNITGTGKFGVSGDIQFLSTAALESDTIKIVQSTGTTGTTGGIITFDGQTGGLFAITDDKDGQLFGVADVSGNDIMYADADWLIKMGNPFQLSGSPFELKYDNVSGNTTLSTNAINVNLNVQNITSTGVTSNIDVTKSIIKISTTTSADLLTLPDGVEGQVISIIYVAETAGADDVTITPTNLLGYTTIFLTLIGTGCELYFTDGSWVVKSQNNVTLS